MRLPVLLLVLTLSLNAADWPAFGGPNHNFQVTGAPLVWPAAGPKRLWERPLGDGYSPIAVEGSALYTMYRRENKEVVVSLDAASGKTLWEYAYDAPLPADYDFFHGSGPRTTPLVIGDWLITAGVSGKVHCLDRTTGKVRWARDLIKDFGGKLRANGYAASPVAVGDTVIVFPSAPDAAIAALKQSDGSVVWKKHSYTVSYATPLLIEVGGKQQLVAQFSDEVTGLDPATGDLLWSHPHTNDQKVNVAMPVWVGESDGLMFLSSAYSGSSRVLRVSGSSKVEEVWTNRLVRIHHSNAVRIGDIVYASSGDNGPCPLAAVDVKTGKVYWRDRAFTKSSLIAIGSQLLILDEEGTLYLALPSEKGMEIQGKMSVLSSTAWTPPTLVGKRVYVRDAKNIVALSLE